MHQRPVVGTTHELRFVVEARHCIDFAVEGMPVVLSTPWLIWFLEHAARGAVLSALEPGESTVGRSIEVDHLAATPVGHTVCCTARIVRVEPPEVDFQLEAHDEVESIARGFHRLRIISVSRFAERLRRKTG